jgi:hypothetical protein
LAVKVAVPFGGMYRFAADAEITGFGTMLTETGAVNLSIPESVTLRLKYVVVEMFPGVYDAWFAFGISV